MRMSVCVYGGISLLQDRVTSVSINLKCRNRIWHTLYMDRSFQSDFTERKKTPLTPYFFNTVLEKHIFINLTSLDSQKGLKPLRYNQAKSFQKAVAKKKFKQNKYGNIKKFMHVKEY